MKSPHFCGPFYLLPVLDCCKNFSYSFELQRVKRHNKRKLAHQKRLENYINPLTKAHAYKKMMEKEGLNQTQLAKKLGISRARVTQYLNLLRLSQDQQQYILANGKGEIITERSLRSFSQVR
ncbi:MAG: hypothetical protein DRN14_07535 [Thermoplasmata archaeon]|nr:MAG: hypothetical protein DRN14_07535 [Thermoplasmata archaeon]